MNGHPSLLISSPHFVTTLERKWRTDTDLCLDVERDEAVCDQVVDGLEPLLPDKVLPVMVETEVSRLVAEPGNWWKKEGQKQAAVP